MTLSTDTKILVIDDEEANVRVLSISLRSDGFEVVTAYSGEEGLEVFKTESPELVLTDIKMPGMDGIEVLQKIKALDPDAEVIIITGHGDIDNAIEALKFGASDFINKPIRDEVLSVSIQRAQEKRYIKRKLREYTDTLEQKVAQATRELRRQSDFQVKLIQSATDGIIATDSDQNIVIFNPGAEYIFGYTQQEVVGHYKLTDLVPDQARALIDHSANGPGPASELTQAEVQIRSKDQALIPVSFYGTALYEDQELMGSVCFFQDLREIKRLKAELLHAERLAAIGQTVAGVAHGVKNILHGFKGGSYLVDLGINRNDSEKLEKGWEMIQRNITRTSDLVLDLLSYSKQREPEPQACLPNAVVLDVCEVLQAVAAENQVALITDLDQTIETVLLDPRTLHQSLTNLISNAIDACLFDENTDKTWQVQIQTRRLDDGYLGITICDNGLGMEPEVQAKLFTSFFSTKGHRGTGLGLLVTRKVIEEHGGTIEVESEKGSGTCFTIRLPYVVEKKGH
jgi:PAS domain S-box-containing protein